MGVRKRQDKKQQQRIATKKQQRTPQTMRRPRQDLLESWANIHIGSKYYSDQNLSITLVQFNIFGALSKMGMCKNAVVH